MSYTGMLTVENCCCRRGNSKKLLRSAKGSRSTASGSRKLSTVFALKPDEEKTLERLFSGRSIVDTPPQRRRSTRMENDIQYKRIASQIKLTAKMRKMAHMLGRSVIVCTVILLYAIIIPLFRTMSDMHGV